MAAWCHTYMRLLVLTVALAGCGGMSPGTEASTDSTAGIIQYDVFSPYRITGTAQSGSDGFVYSVLPCAPLACDPWKLTFCYQSTCFTLSDGLEWIPEGETASIANPANGTLTISGSGSCPSWTSKSTVTWYDATPMHWHVAINATCSDQSVAIVGDWQRVN